MKRILFLLLLIPSLAWGQVSTSGVSLSGCSSGGVSAAACNVANDEVGSRTDLTNSTSVAENNIICQLFIADCSGTLSYAYISHHGTNTDNAKVGVFDSVYQGDIDASHAPDASDTQVSGSSWVTITGCDEDDERCESGTEVGGSVTAGAKYFVCVMSDATSFDINRSTSSTHYAYDMPAGTWGSYASPPNNLDDGDKTWSATASRNYSMWVTIK